MTSIELTKSQRRAVSFLSGQGFIEVEVEAATRGWIFVIVNPRQSRTIWAVSPRGRKELV